jgi:hypothetical protein
MIAGHFHPTSGYRVCLHAGIRTRCQTIAPEIVNVRSVLKVIPGALADASAATVTRGTEWLHENGAAVGCLAGKLWFAEPGAQLRSWGSALCGAVVPDPDPRGACVLKIAPQATIAATHVPALMESRVPTPGPYEAITRVSRDGTGTNVAAPGLLRSSFAFAAAPSGGLYYVSSRPKLVEGAVSRCGEFGHPGCPARIILGAEILRIRPNAVGEFGIAAEVLHEGDNIVAVSLSPNEATLSVTQAESLAWDGVAYQPVNPRSVVVALPR